MNRITIDPEQCGGRPCIRGMRIRVIDVLDLLGNGLTLQEVLDELPDLEPEDIRACLRYASRKLNHPVPGARFAQGRWGEDSHPAQVPG
jgi:uncharacterized protein (DUF433 family)